MHVSVLWLKSFGVCDRLTPIPTTSSNAYKTILGSSIYHQPHDQALGKYYTWMSQSSAHLELRKIQRCDDEHTHNPNPNPNHEAAIRVEQSFAVLRFVLPVVSPERYDTRTLW